MASGVDTVTPDDQVPVTAFAAGVEVHGPDCCQTATVVAAARTGSPPEAELNTTFRVCACVLPDVVVFVKVMLVSTGGELSVELPGADTFSLPRVYDPGAPVEESVRVDAVTDRAAVAVCEVQYAQLAPVPPSSAKVTMPAMAASR